MISNQTGPQSKAYKVHDALAAQPVPPHMWPMTEIGQSSDQVFVDFGTRLGRTDQEPSLPGVIPGKVSLIGQRIIFVKSHVNRFFGQDCAVAIACRESRRMP